MPPESGAEIAQTAPKTIEKSSDIKARLSQLKAEVDDGVTTFGKEHPKGKEYFEKAQKALKEGTETALKDAEEARTKFMASLSPEQRASY